jgi:hypothetical protein
MEHAANELARLAAHTGREEFKAAADRARDRAERMRSGASLYDLAASGDRLAQVLVADEDTAS